MMIFAKELGLIGGQRINKVNAFLLIVFNQRTIFRKAVQAPAAHLTANTPVNHGSLAVRQINANPFVHKPLDELEIFVRQFKFLFIQSQHR